jgi:predicted GTPase
MNSFSPPRHTSYDRKSEQYANQQLKTVYSHLDKLQALHNTATKNTEENHQYVQYLQKEIKKTYTMEKSGNNTQLKITWGIFCTF